MAEGHSKGKVFSKEDCPASVWEDVTIYMRIGGSFRKVMERGEEMGREE